MMYARMPGLAHEELLAGAPPLDLSSARLSPAEAAASLYIPLDHVVVSMRGNRPVYVIGRGRGATTVFADTGETLEGLSAGAAAIAARPYAPPGASLTYLKHLTAPDQWTLQDRVRLPIHVFAAGDAAATHIYVSEVTGTAVLRSTRSERIWGFLGPVIHWIYFTPIRSRGGVWGEIIIWSSVIACVIAVTGLLWGLLRYAPRRRYRIGRESSSTPYTGLLKWHHYAGLLFGVVTFTWAYSGLLSVEPFGWFASEGVTPEQRHALEGDSPSDDALTLDLMRRAVHTLGQHGPPREIESVRFRGQWYWGADSERYIMSGAWIGSASNPRAAVPASERHYVLAATPERGDFTMFDRGELASAAHDAVPGATIAAADWIDAYDSYYYDPGRARSLPVLRVKYADANATWLYLDPRRGAIVDKYQRASRRQRWLYHGLHSLDFPGLYDKRPLWDLVVVTLSLGGLLSSLTAIVPAWRRISRFVARRQPR